MEEQLRQRAMGKMTTAQLEKLNALDGWEWRLPIERDWDGNCEDVEVWYVNNDRHPPSDSYLGKWVMLQRTLKRRREGGEGKQALSDDRFERLDGITGWEWTPKGSRQKKISRSWEARFAELSAHISDSGELPNRISPLGLWVEKQVAGRKSGWLNDAQVDLLASLPGWSWEKSTTRGWEASADDVEVWYKNYERHPPSRTWLGGWVRSQRHEKRRWEEGDSSSLMTAERHARLDAITGWEW